MLVQKEIQVIPVQKEKPVILVHRAQLAKTEMAALKARLWPARHDKLDGCRHRRKYSRDGEHQLWRPNSVALEMVNTDTNNLGKSTVAVKERAQSFSWLLSKPLTYASQRAPHSRQTMQTLAALLLRILQTVMSTCGTTPQL